MGIHSLISTARAESHWFIHCPNQVIWSSNAVLFRIEKESKLCLVTTRVAPAMVHSPRASWWRVLSSLYRNAGWRVYHALAALRSFDGKVSAR